MTELLSGGIWLAAAVLLGVADELHRARRLRRTEGGDARGKHQNSESRGGAGLPRGGPAPVSVAAGGSVTLGEFLNYAANSTMNGGSGDWSAYAAAVRHEAADVNAGRVDAPEREAQQVPDTGKDCGCAPGCRCERVSAESMMRSLEPDGGDR